MISLRKMTAADTENVIKWRNADFVKKNFFYRQDLTAEIHLNWLKQQDNNTLRAFVIEDTEKREDIGSTFLKDINYNAKKAEFGIFIGNKEYLGKGLGGEACKLITKFGFNELGLNKIYLRVLASNASAIRTYKKAGYAIEGVFKDDAFIDGQFIDTVFMACFCHKSST